LISCATAYICDHAGDWGLIHDTEILDRLGAFDPIRFEGEVFRSTRKNLNPLTPSTSGGRWSPKDGPAVLYTSLERDAALAETVFHWSQFTPLPSKPLVVHRIGVGTARTLRLLRADLLDLAVDWNRYAETDYERTQKLGSAVSFLECDGLIVPSARWRCENLVIFTENHAHDERLELLQTEEIDWRAWAKSNNISHHDSSP